MVIVSFPVTCALFIPLGTQEPFWKEGLLISKSEKVAQRILFTYPNNSRKISERNKNLKNP